MPVQYAPASLVGGLQLQGEVVSNLRWRGPSRDDVASSKNIVGSPPTPHHTTRGDLQSIALCAVKVLAIWRPQS